jgi:hypothetical protein
MPQIKLLDSGFTHFTGNLAGYDFEDGVSVDSISEREAMRIAGVVQVESVNGGDVTETSRYNAIKNGEIVAEKQEGEIIADQDKVADQYDFTRESLEALADQKGINGLRELGKQYGIKGQSIVSIIDGLLGLKEGQA